MLLAVSVLVCCCSCCSSGDRSQLWDRLACSPTDNLHELCRRSPGCTVGRSLLPGHSEADTADTCQEEADNSTLPPCQPVVHIRAIHDMGGTLTFHSFSDVLSLASPRPASDGRSPSLLLVLASPCLASAAATALSPANGPSSATQPIQVCCSAVLSKLVAR